ncbi:hypothetical protein FO519_004292, partial [Halicephalobus sp. NKZ332]
ITPFMFKLVLNDSCGKRFWVDSPEAAPTYYGIMTAFGDFVVPAEKLYEKAELITLKRSYIDITTLEKKIDPGCTVFQELIPSTLSLICQRCQEEPTKGIIRTVAFLVNNSDIKAVILKKLDTWLQAIALQRCAPETILFLCVNIPTLNDEKSLQIVRDLLTLHSLQKKQHQTVLLACMEHWLSVDRKNLDALVSIILDLEFSPKQQQKMPHLYVLLHCLYSKDTEETSKIVANKLVAALINPKTVRLVRSFLKEFTKAGFRGDFQFAVFAKYIFEAVRIRINERALFNDDFNAVELLKNSVNICSILPIAVVSTGVKDAGNIRRSGGNLNSYQSESLNKFQSQIQRFMVFCAEFLRWAVTTDIKVQENIFGEFYDQLFYLNGSQSKSLTSSDGWPTEHDYISGLKMIHECTVDEAVLLSLIDPPDFSGINQNTIHTVFCGPVQIVEVLEKLTQRLLNYKFFESDSLISIKSISVLENLFNLASISNFPQFSSVENKTGTLLGVKNLYIRCWKLAVTWTLMSRNTILKESYKEFPMMKYTFYMALTKSDFPLTQFESKSGNQIIADDSAETKKESEGIKKFISEIKDKSFLDFFNPRVDFCVINPKGPPRNFLEIYYHFSKIKEVGTVLCGIRNPDLLKELAKDNLTDQARNTIQEAISRNPNIIEELPILTIGNIFLEDSEKSNEFLKFDETRNMPIKKRLKEALMKRTSDEKEIITFFVSKLCSDSSEERKAALNAIQNLIGDESTKISKIDSLSKLPSFEIYREYICREISHAITLESDMERILNLIGFITKHGVKEGGIFHIIAMRLTMIIERAGSGDSGAHRNVQNSLLEFFVNYLTAASEGEKPSFGSSEFDFGEPLENEAYKMIVASLADSSVGRHPEFKFFIEKFSTTGTKKVSKKEFQSADEILNNLSKNGGQLTPHVLNNLLSRFRQFRPGIVDSDLNDVDFHKQVLELFKSDNSAIRNLIEILAASTMQSTVKKVVSCLLKDFEMSVSSVLVIEFIDKCVKNQERRIIPTANESIILIDYVIADMAVERPSSTTVPQFLVVLEAVMDEYGATAFERILHAISAKIETALTPPMDEPHFVVLNNLINALGDKFCGCREVVESYQNDGKIRYQKIIPKKVREAMEFQDEKRINNAYINMKWHIENNPHVVGSHVQLLTARIIPILAMTKKEYKDPQFLRYLESTLDTVLSTITYAVKEPRDLDLFLKYFIEFFYTRITASHRFKQMFSFLIQICLKYVMLNPQPAKKLLNKEDHVSLFKSMQQVYSDNTYLNSLLRHLGNQQEL